MKIHVHVNPATQKGGNLSNEKLLNYNTTVHPQGSKEILSPFQIIVLYDYYIKPTWCLASMKPHSHCPHTHSCVKDLRFVKWIYH